MGSARSSATWMTSCTVRWRTAPRPGTSARGRAGPSPRRRDGLTSWPAKATDPASAGMKPPITSNNVVLPAPLGPMSPVSPPARTSEGDVVDRHHPAEVLAQPGRRQHHLTRRHGRRPGSVRSSTAPAGSAAIAASTSARLAPRGRVPPRPGQHPITSRTGRMSWATPPGT